MIGRRLVLFGGAAAMPALAGSCPTLAADAARPEPIRIGSLFPLTGASAASGAEANTAIDVACEIINTAHPDLTGLPLATGIGLPNLGGALVEAVHVDHQGDPAVAQSQAQRLITSEHVVALFGAYYSSAALTASAVAEKYSIPFVVSDSVAANITSRGFKWVFRVTPIASNFADTYLRFLGDMKTAGRTVDNIAVVNENTDYGSSVGDAVVAAAAAAGMPVAIRIPYVANGTDVSAQVIQLKQKNPSVVIFISYASDAILFMRTMKSLNYLPSMVIGDSAGFSDPGFLPAVGDISQGLMNRSAWTLGPAGSLSAGVNAIYKAKTGRDMSDVSGRVMQAWFVLADAINRAGSAAPAKIQQALAETNMPPSAMLVGYRGVRFDQTGQNVESATYLTQLQGRDYVTTWPVAPGTARQIWPMKGWNS
jgi:branched-chain amino acid transport system substrate-binding protein